MRCFPGWAGIGLGLVLFLCPSPAPATDAPALESPGPRTHVGRDVVRVELLDARDRPLPLPMVAGWPSASLEAGGQYRLRLTNLTPRRLLVVVSVDGIDPAHGRRAYRGQPGLVLQPGESRILAHARPAPGAPAAAFLQPAPAPGHGEVALQVFQERKDYPTQMPGVPAAPFSPEYFRISASGEREWLPPRGYPFRPLSRTPVESPYLRYQVKPASRP